ncbi:MAG: vWA domain-containing protein, partial [Myxococcota bacterium]
MFFENPIWLLLALPLSLLLWFWRLPSRLLWGFRALSLMCVVLAMSQLSILWKSAGGTVIVLADRSHSMPVESLQRQKEMIRLVQSKMGASNRLAVVSFGRLARIEQRPKQGTFAGFMQQVDADGSNLHQALSLGLSLIPAKQSGRILVLSDGLWTGQSPQTLATTMLTRQIAVDFRMIQRPKVNDLAIVKVEAPSSVQPQEAFLISAWVNTPTAKEVSFRLERNGQLLARGKKRLPAGINRLLFRDLAQNPGVFRYELRVQAPGDDPIPENNQANFLVGIRGQKPLLVVSPTRTSGLFRLLQKAQVPVQSCLPQECRWSLEALSNYSGLLLENIPAQALGHTAMVQIAAWVKQTGSGLMLTGGKNAYGPGGYYKSPLAPVLPVSMELRKEHRKFSLSMMLVLDRSCSMGARVDARRTKMDLANLASVHTLELLSDFDELGVLAVDSSNHLIAPLAPVRDKQAVEHKILSIDSAGGGIFVYEGLSAAVGMLIQARSHTRHIILFADAADAEQPGAYKKLLKAAGKANITVSVIGLGKPTDRDAALLKSIAKHGKGRIFFTENAQELPQLFAQDTFSVIRNAFVQEQTPFRWLPGLQTLTRQAFPKPPNVGGYNLCYRKPKTQVSAVTSDSYNAPLIASWHVGLGRALAYTAEVDGAFAGPIANWSHTPRLLSSLAQWTLGPPQQLPPHMMLTQTQKNGHVQIELHLDPERKNTFSKRPRVRILRGKVGDKPGILDMPLQWVAPHRLALSLPLKGNETVLSSVRIGTQTVTMPPIKRPYSPEFQPQLQKTKFSLQTLAAITGGQERLSLGSLWSTFPKTTQSFSLVPWLVWLAIVFFLLEIFEYRSGFFEKRMLRLAGTPSRHAQNTVELVSET